MIYAKATASALYPKTKPEGQQEDNIPRVLFTERGHPVQDQSFLCFLRCKAGTDADPEYHIAAFRVLFSRYELIPVVV